MKEVEVKKKGHYRAGKAVQRQLTAKGREALAQRPKGEANEVEQADSTVEQIITVSVSEVKGAAHRGGQKVKVARQRKRTDIKERQATQVPREPGTGQPITQDCPTIRERPQQAKQGEQAKVSPEAKLQQPQATPQSHPKTAQRGIKERKADISQRPAASQTVNHAPRIKAETPAPPAKGTPPVSQSEAATPRPEAYQGKMRQATIQQHREQTIRQKAATRPELSVEQPTMCPMTSHPGEPSIRQTPRDESTPPTEKQASVGKPTPTPEKHVPVGQAATLSVKRTPTSRGAPRSETRKPVERSTPPPTSQALADKAIPTPTPSAKEAAPPQSGGSRFAIREKAKTNPPKEKPSRSKVAIRTRQQMEKIVRKSPAKPIKASQPSKQTAKILQKQAQKQMKHHSQRKLAQQARKAAQNTAKTAGKAIVAAAKAVAAAISAIAGVVGGGVLLVALCVIFLVAAVVASPFGIFFAGQDPPPDAVTPREVVAEVNAEYDAKIENLKAGSYDHIEMTGAPADWRDVLTVFAVKTAGSNDGMDVATLDADRITRLKAVYWDMTEIKTRVELIEHSDGEGGTWLGS